MFKSIFLKITITLIILSLVIFPMSASAAESDYFNLIDNSPLLGYSYAFFGDSISFGAGEENVHEFSQMKGWGGRIKNKHGIISRNVSFSGAAVSTNKEINKGNGVAEKNEVWTILKQLNKLWDSNYNPDVYVLHGGVNDCGTNTIIGSLNPNYNAFFNRATFAGALEDTFSRIYKKNPKALILYVINFKLIDTVSQYYNENYDDFAEMTRQVCDKWHVTYLDLHENAELNNTLQNNRGNLLPDGVHPSSKGYEVITPIVEEFLIEQVEKYRTTTTFFDPFSQDKENEKENNVSSSPSVTSSGTNSTVNINSEENQSNSQNSNSVTSSSNEMSSVTENSETSSQLESSTTVIEQDGASSTNQHVKNNNDNTTVIIAVIIGGVLVIALGVLVIVLIKKKAK